MYIFIWIYTVKEAHNCLYLYYFSYIINKTLAFKDFGMHIGPKDDSGRPAPGPGKIIVKKKLKNKFSILFCYFKFKNTSLG